MLTKFINWLTTFNQFESEQDKKFLNNIFGKEPINALVLNKLRKAYGELSEPPSFNVVLTFIMHDEEIIETIRSAEYYSDICTVPTVVYLWRRGKNISEWHEMNDYILELWKTNKYGKIKT